MPAGGHNYFAKNLEGAPKKQNARMSLLAEVVASVNQS